MCYRSSVIKCYTKHCMKRFMTEEPTPRRRWQHTHACSSQAPPAPLKKTPPYPSQTRGMPAAGSTVPRNSRAVERKPAAKPNEHAKPPSRNRRTQSERSQRWRHLLGTLG